MVYKALPLRTPSPMHYSDRRTCWKLCRHLRNYRGEWKMRQITLLAVLISLVILPCCNKAVNSDIKEAGLENGAMLDSDSQRGKSSLEIIKPEFRSLIGSFRNLLEKKRKDPSFCAQYQFSLSLRPRIAAGTRKNIFIQSKGSYYADEKAEN